MVKRDMFYFADIDEKFIDSTKDNEGLEDGVLVHCQQCIEKNLKAIIQNNILWNKTGFIRSSFISFFTIIQWQLLKYYPYLLLLNDPILILLFYDKY